MGWRDWFRTRAPLSEETSIVISEEVESPEPTFEEMQHQRMLEAEALFSQPESSEDTVQSIDAPYDASHAEVEALLESEVGEAFTHLDEVEVVDVAALEDPYETAIVEGDLPSPVRFDEAENDASV
jgi:hypothetical protein